MEYRATQILVDILLSHGFKEYTHSLYPTDWEKLRNSSAYSPNSVKRELRFGRLRVFFNYINIWISYNSSGYDKTIFRLPESELRSLLLFTKLSTTDRAYLNRHSIYPSNIAEYVAKYSVEDREYLRVSTRAKIEYFEEALKEITI